MGKFIINRIVNGIKIKRTNYDFSQIRKNYDQHARPVFHEPRPNDKTGVIYCWNILPLLTCSAIACATCGIEGCYAVKNLFTHGYNWDTNAVMQAWSDNTRLVMENLPEFYRLMNAWLARYELNNRFFRIHSSGDFYAMDYLKTWVDLINNHKGVKFLAFTKAFNLIREYDKTHPGAELYTIENFELVLSGWTGCDIPEDLKAHYRCAYCVEKGDTPPEGAVECPGACDTCGLCWSLTELGIDTYFNKH